MKYLFEITYLNYGSRNNYEYIIDDKIPSVECYRIKCIDKITIIDEPKYVFKVIYPICHEMYYAVSSIESLALYFDENYKNRKLNGLKITYIGKIMKRGFKK